MSKDPAILFYTSDFLTQCSSLTMAERGEYITLVCLQHQMGHITQKTIDLIFNHCLSEDVFQLLKQDKNGCYYNEYWEEVIRKRQEYTESRRKNRQGKTKQRNI